LKKQIREEKRSKIIKTCSSW